MDALYASLFEDKVKRLDLHDMPLTHNGTVSGDPKAPGPALLNVLKYLDIPQATAMAAMRSKVVIYSADKPAWDYPTTVTKNLGKETQFQVRQPVTPEEGKEEPKKKEEAPKKSASATDTPSAYGTLPNVSFAGAPRKDTIKKDSL